MLRDWINRALASVGGHPPAPGAESRFVHGIRVDVINTREDIDTERVFRRADAVIQRVAEYQPWRLAHIRRDIAGIVVQRYACRAAYFGDANVIMLELTFMANEQFSDSQVAASLVHEGMHARLGQLSARYGVTPFADARARHERICRRAELDLGLAVPDGAPVVQRALDSMALADDEVAPRIEWAEAVRRVDAVDRGEA
ncbi:MAG TPA: hypothetical protein VGP25_05660 [Gemmatimonadaceae bacterium]|jgi:hypothetical protein|nr:hypothetical protein [Gemmatimonadaceae bacterium]